MTSSTAPRDRLMTPGEVAAIFRVDPKTVSRWAKAGRISSIRTPGGHRRYRESEVRSAAEDEWGSAQVEETAVAALKRTARAWRARMAVAERNGQGVAWRPDTLALIAAIDALPGEPESGS